MFSSRSERKRALWISVIASAMGIVPFIGWFIASPTLLLSACILFMFSDERKHYHLSEYIFYPFYFLSTFLLYFGYSVLRSKYKALDRNLTKPIMCITVVHIIAFVLLALVAPDLFMWFN